MYIVPNLPTFCFEKKLAVVNSIIIFIFIMRFLSKINAFSFNTKLKLLVILSTYVACSIRYSFVNLCQSPKVHLQIGSIYAHK